MIVDTEELAKGVLAYTEYQISMPDGNEARLAFTFGDLTSDSIPAKYARMQGALAYGLVFIADLPDAPEFPLLWTQGQRFIAVTGAEGDREITENLTTIVARFMAIFFADIAPIAPELAAVKMLVPMAANDHSRI